MTLRSQPGGRSDVCDAPGPLALKLAAASSAKPRGCAVPLPGVGPADHPSTISKLQSSAREEVELFSGLPQKLGKRNRTLHHAMLRRYREWVLFRSMPADTLLAEGATDTEADDSTSPVCPNDTKSAKSQHCSCTWIVHSRRLLEDCSKRLHFRNLTTRGEFCLSCTMVSDGRVLSTWPAQPSTAEC